MSDSSEDAEFTDGEEEDEGDVEDPVNDAGEKASSSDSSTPERRRSTKRPISYSEDNSDKDSDDSEDDIPLAQLAEKRASNREKNGKGKKEQSSPKKKKAATPTRKPPPTTNNSSNKTYEYASDAMYQTECDKGLIIQRLLCRWWYAYEWPTNVPEEPPKDYDTLDGFKGVFICTSGDNAGHILDTRDHSATPSFQNFAQKSTAELQKMLLKAIDQQLAALQAQQHSHNTLPLQKELQEMRKWAARVNADKADKEATKVLKSSKIKLLL